MAFGHRRDTVTASVGGVQIGSGYPVVVQSMTNTDTADAVATAGQVAALAAAGSQLVRVTVNNEEAAAAVPEIARRVADQGVDVPIVGDFHYNGHLLLAKFPECARALAKYRINPGNVGSKRRDENFRSIVRVAIENDKPVRIGVNWGSLDQDLLTSMMDENAALAEPRDAKDVYIEAMIESALRSAALAEDVTFLVYYAFKGTPLIMGLPQNVTDPYPICRESNTALQKALWMAIAWITFETIVSWWAWTRLKKPAAPATSQPPYAPPSR